MNTTGGYVQRLALIQLRASCVKKRRPGSWCICLKTALLKDSLRRPTPLPTLPAFTLTQPSRSRSLRLGCIVYLIFDSLTKKKLRRLLLPSESEKKDAPSSELKNLKESAERGKKKYTVGDKRQPGRPNADVLSKRTVELKCKWDECGRIRS